jgi:hypothetical protein
MSDIQQGEYRHHRYLVSLRDFLTTDGIKLYPAEKLAFDLRNVPPEMLASDLSEAVWTPSTLLVVWVLELRLPVVGKFGTLLETLSDVRKQLAGARSSTTQWQYLPKGANFTKMTGMRVFVDSPKHRAVAILCLKYNLLVSGAMADKWSRVFLAVSIGQSMIVNNEALKATRQELARRQELDWQMQKRKKRPGGCMKVQDFSENYKPFYQMKTQLKSLKAQMKSLEARNKSLEDQNNYVENESLIIIL